MSDIYLKETKQIAIGHWQLAKPTGTGKWDLAIELAVSLTGRLLLFLMPVLPR